MKTKILLWLLMSLISLNGFCTLWTVTNTGFAFTPSDITINLGDSVKFNLATIHNATEVSQATWSTNGTTPLPGGFQTAFGGGMVLPDKLTVGIHYFVCTNHAFMGMIGTILVQNSTSGIIVNQIPSNISLYPNPSNGKINLTIAGFPLDKNCNMEIYNLQGELINQSVITNIKTEIDISRQPKGIYFVKIYSGLSTLTKRIIIQ